MNNEGFKVHNMYFTCWFMI